MHLLTREKVWFCVLRSFRDPPRDLTLLSLKCRTLYRKVLWLLQFYSASFTEDLRQVVKHVGTSFPTSRLYAAGWSLGANILVRYLGQEGEHCPLSGAVSLCNPFDLVAADKDFHKGFNNLYDKALARGLRKNIKKHAALFTNIGGEYNIPKATVAKSVRDFDDGLTRGMPVNSGH
jgi:predicted alpha/beta-fold hydrolase